MYLNWLDNILEGLIDTYDTNDIYELYDYLEIKLIKLEPNNILLKEMNLYIIEIILVMK